MPTKVNSDNFNRAETEKYMRAFVADGGGGKFIHTRRPADVARQTVIRMNRDTLYSAAVIDLNAGPATVTLPDGNGRYVALQAIDQDHYVARVAYEAGDPLKRVGTRYMAALVRIGCDANDPADVAEANALQDRLSVSQRRVGEFTFGKWNKATQDETRQLLLGLASLLPDLRGAFGRRGEVSPVRHLIGTAFGWGGNPDSDALYIPTFVRQSDGVTPYVLDVPPDVPVDAFWSVAVYNADGYFEPNDRGLYSLSSVTAKKSADGSVTIRFGGDPHAGNYLPITAGWNYVVRLYRPRPEAVDGTWVFPQPIAVV